MQLGTVKYYNSKRGFGFIQPDDGGEDVFIHATALERAGTSSLSEGQKVTFGPEKYLSRTFAPTDCVIGCWKLRSPAVQGVDVSFERVT